MLRRVLAGACLASALALLAGEVRPPPPATTTVVTAGRDVPAGAELARADLDLDEVRVDAVQPGAVTDPAAVLGRRVGSALVRGEALTRSRLVPVSPADGLGAGEVAVHVVAADPAVLGLLGPGQRVTVVPSAGGAPLARDARVLATDPPTEPGLLEAGGVPARGLVLGLSATAAERLLSGHGGLDGPPVVNIVATGGG